MKETRFPGQGAQLVVSDRVLLPKVASRNCRERHCGGIKNAVSYGRKLPNPTKKGGEQVMFELEVMNFGDLMMPKPSPHHCICWIGG